MKRALLKASLAFDQNEVPVGALIVQNGQIISESHNLCHALKDPTAHAEALAIRSALLTLDQPFLENCDLYVTLEPCVYCAGAIALTRIKRVYFGAYDPKGGGVEHGARVFEHSLHKPQTVGGICETKSTGLLKAFFESRRFKKPIV